MPGLHTGHTKRPLKENETLHFFLIKIKMQLISQLSVLGEQLATCRRRLWAGRQHVFASKTFLKNVVYFFLTLSGSSSLLPTKLAAGRFLVYRLVNGVNHCKPLAIWSLETHGSADGFLLPYYLFHHISSTAVNSMWPTSVNVLVADVSQQGFNVCRSSAGANRPVQRSSGSVLRRSCRRRQ